MPYLIDGYNLLFQLTPDINPIALKREQIIEELSELVELLKLKAIIVFDSGHYQTQDFPSRFKIGKLEVIFSPQNQSADDYIIEYLKSCKKPKTHTLVSNDNYLKRFANENAIPSLTIPSFVRKILLKKKRVEKKEKKVLLDNDKLEQIFEKRLKEIDDK
ncbi:MAG: NYN domain-containing protein [Simkaniaceae bacterium]